MAKKREKNRPKQARVSDLIITLVDKETIHIGTSSKMHRFLKPKQARRIASTLIDMADYIET